ncbi:MAG TPA: signal peptidase II [Fimbriimonadaceae bacterium]|nr:signal peptidase II [Fimbriimonadaceae bacterium]
MSDSPTHEAPEAGPGVGSFVAGFPQTAKPEAQIHEPTALVAAKDRRWVFLVLLIAMLAIDQAIKYWSETHLVPGQASGWPWPKIFELQLTHNEGIAFGFASGHGQLFTPIALAISFGAAYYSWRHPRESAWMHTAMGLLAAGALGNLYDRVRYGYVRDMFATRFINFPVFNWADTCITIATAILILIWTKEAFDARGKRDAKRNP